MKATGSLRAAASVGWLSRVRYLRPCRAKRRASVVFPDWRGPLMATTRVSRKAVRMWVSASRGYTYLPLRCAEPGPGVPAKWESDNGYVGIAVRLRGN